MTDTAPLVAACLEIERHVSASGWDQPARLFALVETEALLAAEPALAAQLAAASERPDGSLTAIEQDEFHAGGDLVADLERIGWPEAVQGCALALERSFVPPEVEGEIPSDAEAAAEFVHQHPARQDVRVVVGVLRTGAVHGLARLKSTPDELLGGADLVPGLGRALARTLE